jgi:hypothetical protein
LISILLNSPLLMICQINPKIKCSLPSEISCDPMLTTEHPIPLEEVMTILLFSVIWNAFRARLAVGLLRTRSSIVSGTESLINLQRIRPSTMGIEERGSRVQSSTSRGVIRRTSRNAPRHSSNSCMVSVGIGRSCPTSESPAKTYPQDVPQESASLPSPSPRTHTRTYSINMIRKTPPLILIDRMLSVRPLCPLHGDLSLDSLHILTLAFFQKGVQLYPIFQLDLPRRIEIGTFESFSGGIVGSGVRRG